MKYKYKYTGSGTMSFWDSKKNRYDVSKENEINKSEVILDEKINVAGMQFVEKIGTNKKSKAKKPGGK